ncbi:GNAT family N-acetyltransferase [Planococcus salinus]|uniref:GNAT family N-acetyltransferase n=1 Tax=Planococcus salinus TaxID=1848460 RepID=A0A3M8P3Z5_9BACL|nr:GNAT family N-acetyltransferase [Planococcus salinus]RNF38403.1 GNAT family N-acetyltransferase [Planococcus salinus]
MHELVPVHDHTKWKKIVESFEDADIYYNRQYFLSAVKLDPGEPFLFYYRDDHGEVAYPFIKRKIMKGSMDFYDITTPFGYGGPILNIVDSTRKLVQHFREEFSEFCSRENIIAEFIRFHPWKKNALLFEDHLTVLPLYDTFSIDLNQLSAPRVPLEEDNGGALQTTGSQEPTVKKLGTVRHMFEFLVLYYSAVRRRDEADSYYFFTDDYFEALVSSLGPNLHLFGAYYENKLVTACYVLTTEDTIYHHLEGSLDEPGIQEAMKALLLKIAEWGKENYYTSFLLGGDYKGESETADKTRQEISNRDPELFYVGHKIHNEAMFKELISAEETDIVKRYRNV